MPVWLGAIVAIAAAGYAAFAAPRDGRRSTILILFPATMLVAFLLAFAAGALMGRAGWQPAEGNRLALAILPLLWAMLTVAVLTMPGRRQQALLLLLPAAAGALVLFVGPV